MKLYKIILVQVFMWLSTPSFAAGVDTPRVRIESLLDSAWQQYADARYIASLNAAYEALRASHIIAYDEGIGRAHIYAANALMTMGVYKEGLGHLSDAGHTAFYKNTLTMQVEACRLRGRTFTSLKLYDSAIKEYEKQLHVSQKLKDTATRNLSLLFTHQNLVTVYNELKLPDSVWQQVLRQEEILKRFNEQDSYYYVATALTQKAQVLIARRELNQAKECLDRAIDLIKRYQAVFTHTTLKVYGDLELARGDRSAAESYYKAALQNAVKIQDVEGQKVLCKSLYDFYAGDKNSIKEANKYLVQFHELKDSLDRSSSQTLELAMEHVLREKQKGEQSNPVRNVMFGSVVALLFVSSVTGYKLLKKRKRRLLQDTIAENNDVVKLEQETSMPCDLTALLALAKEVGPEFLLKFELNFPQFINNLKEIDPNIRSNELVFCAMTYLNFSSKDIATYTFVTVRAVQVRKNRLRKKYGIPSDMDFNVWMRNLNPL